MSKIGLSGVPIQHTSDSALVKGRRRRSRTSRWVSKTILGVVAHHEATRTFNPLQKSQMSPALIHRFIQGRSGRRNPMLKLNWMEKSRSPTTRSAGKRTSSRLQNSTRPVKFLNNSSLCRIKIHPTLPILRVRDRTLGATMPRLTRCKPRSWTRS